MRRTLQIGPENFMEAERDSTRGPHCSYSAQLSSYLGLTDPREPAHCLSPHRSSTESVVNTALSGNPAIGPLRHGQNACHV
jgi:hypothetical protein